MGVLSLEKRRGLCNRGVSALKSVGLGVSTKTGAGREGIGGEGGVLL